MRSSSSRVLWCCLPLCLLAPAAGCKDAPPPYASVSGTVFFQGEPLPGGRITFVAVKGAYASSATIREDGSYNISAPTGDVQIGVDNLMLLGRRGAPAQPPQSEEMKKHSAGAADPITGRYVVIPKKYASPDTSGLTYTVQPGDQTHDVTLP